LAEIFREAKVSMKSSCLAPVVSSQSISVYCYHDDGDEEIHDFCSKSSSSKCTTGMLSPNWKLAISSQKGVDLLDTLLRIAEIAAGSKSLQRSLFDWVSR
jgi:hypothetical protein